MDPYFAVICQGACPAATSREQLDKNIDYACEFVRRGAATYSLTAPVKLLAFAEFNMCGYPGADSGECGACGSG